MTLGQRVCSTILIAYLVLGGPGFVFAQKVTPPAEQDPGDLAAANVTIDFELVRACLLPDSKESRSLADYGMTLSPPQPRLGRLNTKCDHQRLLAEGVSIHALNKHYQKRKLEVASEIFKNQQYAITNKLTKKTVISFSKAAKDADLVQHFVMDGTCLLSDFVLAKKGRLTEAVDRCLARLTVAVTDAEQLARKEIIRLGEARKELTVDKQAITDLNVVVGGANKDLPDAPKNKIGKDIVALAKPLRQPPPANAQQQQQQKIPPTRQLLKEKELAQRSAGSSTVEFTAGQHTADAAALAKSGQLFGTKKEDLSAIDGRKSKDGNSTVEVSDVGKQASFAKELGDLSDKTKFLTQRQQRDAQDIKNTVEAIKEGKVTRLPGRPLVSELAFVGVVEDMVQAAKEKKEKDPAKQAKLGDDAVNELNVELPLGDNSSAGKAGTVAIGGPQGASGASGKPQNTAKPLDQEVRERMKAVESAIETIKNSPPD